ncbi:hypothetical protein [Actinomadura sp. NTSP31]|uniref:hypothetical protein n=1 Tax=Actinomadura sp. NTSP31 TaxID=1735447 RepID=UPI0035C00414
MRPLSVTVWGTALVAAGLLAPATGQASTSGQDGLTVRPGVARTGEKVALSVPGCGPGRHWASSEAFGGRVRLDGTDGTDGTATIRDGVRPGAYEVVAHCRHRTVKGKVRVGGRPTWPALLPGTRDGL